MKRSPILVVVLEARLLKQETPPTPLQGIFAALLRAPDSLPVVVELVSSAVAAEMQQVASTRGSGGVGGGGVVQGSEDSLAAGLFDVVQSRRQRGCDVTFVGVTLASASQMKFVHAQRYVVVAVAPSPSIR